MDITSAQYKNDELSNDENVVIEATIDGVEMFVPIDPDNRHYAAILEAVSEGTLTIADAD